MRTVLFFLCLSLSLICQPTSALEFQNGDIIFQSSNSSQGRAIETATKSPFSHVGLILYQDGEPHVFEAAATVQFTPVQEWVKRGRDGDFTLMRLKGSESVFTQSGIKSLFETARKFQGKPYDVHFRWSDDRIYCSELVWKIYHQALGLEVGDLSKFKDYDLSDANVQAHLKERYGTKIPYEETVIPPSGIFDSHLLRKVN